jgi:hypothetical protein
MRRVSKLRWAAATLSWVCCVPGCDARTKDGPIAADPVAVSTPRAAPPVKLRVPEPELAFATEASAYHARLYSDASTFYLVTPSAVFRLQPDVPIEGIPLPSGTETAWSKAGLVLWVDGQLELLDLATAKRRKLRALPARPRALAAWLDSVAWSERTAEGASLVRTNAAVGAVYRSLGSVETITMLSDWVFFVERLPDRTWRIGAVPAAGGAPRFTRVRSGRVPARLVTADEALHYYDGNTREVRRIGPDLRDETVLGRDDVCSPLAVVGKDVFCARVEGLFQLVPDEPIRPLTAPGRHGLVTDIATTARRVAWITEAGDNRLEVHALTYAP